MRVRRSHQLEEKRFLPVNSRLSCHHPLGSDKGGKDPSGEERGGDGYNDDDCSQSPSSLEDDWLSPKHHYNSGFWDPRDLKKDSVVSLSLYQRL